MRSHFLFCFFTCLDARRAPRGAALRVRAGDHHANLAAQRLASAGLRRHHAVGPPAALALRARPEEQRPPRGPVGHAAAVRTARPVVGRADAAEQLGLGAQARAAPPARAPRLAPRHDAGVRQSAGAHVGRAVVRPVRDPRREPDHVARRAAAGLRGRGIAHRARKILLRRVRGDLPRAGDFLPLGRGGGCFPRLLLLHRVALLHVHVDRRITLLHLHRGLRGR